MPKYLINITETNERRAVVEAETAEQARELAEAVWNDDEQGYDAFRDMQEVGHTTECLGLADEDDMKRLPELEPPAGAYNCEGCGKPAAHINEVGRCAICEAA